MNAIERHLIHPTAIVSASADLPGDVSIGAFSIVYANVHLGTGCVVGPYCSLGEPLADYYAAAEYVNPSLEIGEGALIRSGTILYAGSAIGDHFETGHRAIVREETEIGHHVRIGINADIQGYCRIGDYVRMHSGVHVGQYSQVGNFVWLFPFCVLTNDPHPPSDFISGVQIEDFSVIGAKAVLMPGIRVGRQAVIGAGAVVYHDVLPESVMAGHPARKIATFDQIKNRATGEPAYPWPEHFERGMPWQGIGFETWDKLRRDGCV